MTAAESHHAPPWKVQHAADKLTACRCSSSYWATTWATWFRKQGVRKKDGKRRCQTKSELRKGEIIIKEETAGGNEVGLVTAGRTHGGVTRERNLCLAMCDGAPCWKARGRQCLSPSAASSVLPAVPSAPSCSPAETTSSAPVHLSSVCNTHTHTQVRPPLLSNKTVPGGCKRTEGLIKGRLHRLNKTSLTVLMTCISQFDVKTEALSVSVNISINDLTVSQILWVRGKPWATHSARCGLWVEQNTVGKLAKPPLSLTLVQTTPPPPPSSSWWVK